MKFGGAPVERPSREIQSPHAPRTLPAKISARRQRLKCAMHIRKDLIAEDIHILILIFNRRPEHWPRMPYSRQVAGVREPNLTLVECPAVQERRPLLSVELWSAQEPPCR